MKKLATIQVDVDSFWTLLNFYGYDGPPHETRTIYEIAIPRMLEIFRRFKVKATFFVVGRDLLDERNQVILRQIVEEGHEIANHTMNHPFGFSKLSRERKEREICEAERIIERMTGMRPRGFRAPGYDMDTEALHILESRDYVYDSSVFPSTLGPLMKLLTKDKGTSIGRSIKNCSAPITPYYPSRKDLSKKEKRGKILEIPITAVPYVRLPFYANFNIATGRRLFDVCYALIGERPLNYLFHAIELVDMKDDIDRRLIRHPNLSLPLDRKAKFYEHILDRITSDYEVVTTEELAGG